MPAADFQMAALVSGVSDMDAMLPRVPRVVPAASLAPAGDVAALAGGSPRTDEIPLVAGHVEEYGDVTVGLGARLGDEFDASGPHP